MCNARHCTHLTQLIFHRFDVDHFLALFLHRGSCFELFAKNMSVSTLRDFYNKNRKECDQRFRGLFRVHSVVPISLVNQANFTPRWCDTASAGRTRIYLPFCFNQMDSSPLTDISVLRQGTSLDVIQSSCSLVANPSSGLFTNPSIGSLQCNVSSAIYLSDSFGVAGGPSGHSGPKPHGNQASAGLDTSMDAGSGGDMVASLVDEEASVSNAPSSVGQFTARSVGIYAHGHSYAVRQGSTSPVSSSSYVVSGAVSAATLPPIHQVSNPNSVYASPVGVSTGGNASYFPPIAAPCSGGYFYDAPVPPPLVATPPPPVVGPWTTAHPYTLPHRSYLGMGPGRTDGGFVHSPQPPRAPQGAFRASPRGGFRGSGGHSVYANVMSSPQDLRLGPFTGAYGQLHTHGHSGSVIAGISPPKAVANGTVSDSNPFIVGGYAFPGGLNRKERRRILFLQELDAEALAIAVRVPDSWAHVAQQERTSPQVDEGLSSEAARSREDKHPQMRPYTNLTPDEYAEIRRLVGV